MKLLWGAKDGGPESRVWCWGIESKRFGSLLILKFAKGSREAYHTHAFNSLSWVLRGRLHEHHHLWRTQTHVPQLRPIRTKRSTFHMVSGVPETTWVFTLRGPWTSMWQEYIPATGRIVGLTHGRKEILRCPVANNRKPQ
jgi:hypothetical protein